MRFLISRQSALGDVVCSLPAAGELKRAFPDCHVTWAVSLRFAGIVECCRFVDEVVPVKSGFSPAKWPRVPGKFDAALDLQGLLKSGIVVGLAKAGLKLGYHWQREFSFFFSKAVMPDPSSVHIVDQYVDVARAAVAELKGTPGDGPAEFGLVPREEDVEKIREMAGDGYAVVNPGAGWVTKRWPAASFASVMAACKVPYVMIGGRAAADRAAADELLEACKTAGAEPPIDLIGKTSVRELVALLASCRAHIGGDTGSSHLAAALGRPAVGLYSITRPERSCPYGMRQWCHYDRGGLGAISPSAVVETLKGILA